MAKYDVGDIIRDARKRLGVTQEELAYGICTASTLSRIENSSQVPNPKTFEALMQRLGEPVHLYPEYLSREDLQRHKLCQKIIRALANYDMYSIKSLLEEYRELVSRESILEQQFFLYTRAIYHARMGMDPVYVIQELEEALQAGRPGELQEKKPGSRHLLTFDEIVIWNNLAINYYRSGRKKRAYEVMYQIKDYLEKDNVDEEAKAGVYPMILCNLAIWLYEEDNTQQTIDLCRQGIDYCVTCGRLIVLPYLMRNLASAMKRNGHYQEAQRCMMQARGLFDLMKGHCGQMNREIEISI